MTFCSGPAHSLLLIGSTLLTAMWTRDRCILVDKCTREWPLGVWKGDTLIQSRPWSGPSPLLGVHAPLQESGRKWGCSSLDRQPQRESGLQAPQPGRDRKSTGEAGSQPWQGSRDQSVLLWAVGRGGTGVPSPGPPSLCFCVPSDCPCLAPAWAGPELGFLLGTGQLCSPCGWDCSQEGWLVDRWAPGLGSGAGLGRAALGPRPGGMAPGLSLLYMVRSALAALPTACCAFLTLGFHWGCCC